MKVTNRRLVMFFALTFAISWILWLPAVLKSNGFPELPEIVGLPGMFAPFGPAIAAFWLTWRQSGREGITDLFRRGWTLDFDKRWLLPTVFLMPLIAVVTIAVFQLTGQAIEWDVGLSVGAILPTFLFIYFLNALPEEYGWRGYALGPLLNHHSALVASLLLGFIWGLWHLPLHFIEGSAQEIIPVYQFIMQQMVLAIFYTWLFNNTRGAVSVAILFHTVANVAGATVPYWTSPEGRWTGFAVQVAFALLIILVWGPQHLNKEPANRYEQAVEAVEAKEA